MKYVFFGTPRFAEIVLRGLFDAGLPPAAVVCNPDRPVGRKKTITPPPTKVLTIAHGASIPVLQPEAIDEAFIATLKDIAPDLFVVAAYAKILPKTLLAVPRLGTLGVHPSLLPAYRGSSPIQSSILAGEKETGTTIYLMDERMDHGPVIAAGKVPFDSLATNYLDMEEKLARQGAELLQTAMSAFFNGTATPVTQDEAAATYTKKFTGQDGFVSMEDIRAAEKGDTKKAGIIVRMINALGEEPGVWTKNDVNGKRLKLLQAGVADDGALKIIKVQEEGGLPTAYRSY